MDVREEVERQGLHLLGLLGKGLEEWASWVVILLVIFSPRKWKHSSISTPVPLWQTVVCTPPISRNQ